jgi:alpha-D-ribose 1-methylphosphonate 5-triphosphate synthase subunit PhnL
LLRVTGLQKSFVLHALGGKVISGCRELSFALPAGGFLALAGPSGAGKSTVLKCIYRTYLPSAGTIHYRSGEMGEVDLARAPERTVLELRRREIGYVAQFLRVVPRVPAREVIMEPLLRDGVEPAEARERAERLLERLHIPRALFDASPSSFSGGEQQRINVARAVLRPPRLLLLDEPTASLDRESVAVVRGLLAELRARGTTMLGIFHDLAAVEGLADRVLRMEPAGAGEVAHG